MRKVVLHRTHCELALDVEGGLERAPGKQKAADTGKSDSGGSAKTRVLHAAQVRRGIVLSFQLAGFPRVTFTASAGYIATGMYAAP